MRRWLVLAVLLVFATPASAHEITFSNVELRLDATATLVTVELPLVGILQQEVPPVPAGTTEADLRTDPLRSDIAAALADLVTRALVLRADGEQQPLAVQTITPAGDRIRLTAAAPPIAGLLAVEADLFPGDTLHKTFLTIYRGASLAGQYVLDTASPAIVLDGPARPVTEVIVTFIGEGIRHIFIGPDHILFVIALILLGGRLWSQAKIITAFTVAHSVTLTLATLDIVSLPSRLVESIIALSIIIVGLHDLWQLRRGRTAIASHADLRILFALTFGLVHGFGFASVLGDLDLPQTALAWSLASFNIGVEIGQITIVLAATPVLYLLRHRVPALVGQAVLMLIAFAVVVAGGWWLWERALSA